MKQRLPFEQVEDFQLRRIIQDSPSALAVEAWQESLRRSVFLKLLKPHIRDHQRWLARFHREAQICAGLKHPHIVAVYTIGEREGYIYMAQEFVQGESLKELLAREKSLPPPLALEIAEQTARGLEYVHRNGIIHRDIKPGNLLIDAEGLVRITDFGLAYAGEDAALTREGSILGTPAYMAPEQITGEPLGPVSDFFALGATLYEMLTGMRPFEGENYSACIQKILNYDPPPPSEGTAAVNGLLAGLLHKNPTHRPEMVTSRLSRLPELNPGEQATRRKELGEKISVPEAAVPGRVAVPPERPSVWRFTLWHWAGVVLTLAVLITLYFLRSGETLPAVAENSGSPLVVQPADSTGTDQMEPMRDSVSAGRVQQPPSVKDIAEKSARRRTPVNSGNTLLEKEENPPAENQLSGGEPAAPTPARLLLNIRPWALLRLDGEVVDSAAAEKELAVEPGAHRLLLSHPEFTPRLIELELNPGEQRKIEYSFYQNAGFLTVEVRPWAEVYVDGKYVDTTPLRRPLLLTPGEHLLELKNPYYDTHRQLLTVAVGDTLRVRKQLGQK